MDLRIKRVYEPAEASDGFRILIDRLWPRGVRKEPPPYDLWLRELAPSDELRRWYGHDPAKWEEFKTRYHRELDALPKWVALLREHVAAGTVTLVFGAKAAEISNAAALAEYLIAEEGGTK